MKAALDRLVTLSAPRSAAAEAYRTLRSNILFSSASSPLRALLVTGAGAEDGKSGVAANLAVAFAQAGTRVILADCDLRRPVLHQLFDLSNDKGVTTVLVGEGGGTLPLQPTAIANLRLLTSGPVVAGSADLLGTPGMQQLLTELSAAADLVLLDSSPVGYIADAALLSSRVDAVLLVVTAGTTRRETAVRAKAFLEKAGARFLGVVLDNASVDPGLARLLDEPAKASRWSLRTSRKT